MSLQYIRVDFPKTRPVFVDGREVGKTNVRIQVPEGRHTISLGEPRDYVPKWRRPKVTGTNALRPLPVVFDKLRDEPAGATREAEPVKQVFISYAHEDRRWLEELRTYLAPFNRLLKIDVWDDSKIRPGRRWKSEIRQAVRSSQVAVLLVTNNFLASPFIAEQELPGIFAESENNGMTIFWILVSDCAWEITPIRDYQAAHDLSRSLRLLSTGRRARVLTDVAFKIWRAF